jgi:large subunit ribosomal protein L23
MALFGKKKEEKKDVAAPAAVKAVAAPATGGNSGGRDVSHILRHARITEKATMHSGAGVYTFDINESATKSDVVAAVRALYKVTPLKVAVVTVPSKVRRNMRTGKVGVKRGGRKAYVYLKKGETINMS